MNCRICGAELKKNGELCTNCMNKLMKEQELRNDKSVVITFKSKFILKYQLLLHCEQIGIAIFTIILMLSVDLSYWKYAIGASLLFILFGIVYLIYLRSSLNSVVCTLYRTKIFMSWKKFKKRSREIPYTEVEEVFYTQGNMEKLFGLGTIVIKRRTRNIIDRNIYIESVPNVKEVFGKIEEVFK